MQNYSVLMSVYHKEKPEYLRQAIESIQVQTVAWFITIRTGTETFPPFSGRISN